MAPAATALGETVHCWHARAPFLLARCA